MENTNEKWVITDPSCNQMYRELAEDEIYLFKENRLINPATGETEEFISTMNIHDYSVDDIEDALKTFGYERDECTNCLILECLFELEN